MERIGSPTVAHVVRNVILHVLETWLCNFHCCIFYFIKWMFVRGYCIGGMRRCRFLFSKHMLLLEAYHRGNR